MPACSLFGHRDCSENIKEALTGVLTELIENRGADTFHVGSQGGFDAAALGVLCSLQEKYPHIICCVVLAYPPPPHSAVGELSYENVLLPEGIEYIHPRYAISWRNKWMVDNSDFVVCCVSRDWGGAAQAVKDAKRKGKQVINLCSLYSSK